MGERYEAMVMTGKSGKGWRKKNLAGLRDDRPFAVYDHMLGGWWKGSGTGIAYYKTMEAAKKRAETLNEGTFRSVIGYKKVPEGHTVYTQSIRFLDDLCRPVSPWSLVNNEVRVRTGSGEVYVDDEDGDAVEKFYCGYTGWRGPWKTREGYHIHERVTAQTEEGTMLLTSRVVSLEDWVADRLGIHETLRNCLDEKHLFRIPYYSELDYDEAIRSGRWTEEQAWNEYKRPVRLTEDITLIDEAPGTL